MTGKLAVLDGTAPPEVWDTDKPETVTKAKTTFDRAVKDQGLAAFAVKPGTDTPPRQVREFDPNEGEITLVRPMVGG